MLCPFARNLSLAYLCLPLGVAARPLSGQKHLLDDETSDLSHLGVQVMGLESFL